MTTILTTSDVPATQRIAYWQDAVCRSFLEVDCSIFDEEHFEGAIRQRNVGPLSLLTISAAPLSAKRTAQQIRRASDQCLLFDVRTEGGATICQDSRQLALAPGDISLLDSSRPFEVISHARFSKTTVRVPWELLGDRLGTTHHLTGTRVLGAHPVAKLAADYILELASADEDLSGDVANKLANHAIDLMAMAFSSRPPEPVSQSEDERRTLLTLLKRATCARLNEAQLGVNMMSSFAGLPMWQIDALFRADNTTFEEFVKAERMHRLAQDLTDPRLQNNTLKELAARWQLDDSPELRSSFQRIFGLSPLAFRSRPLH